MFVAFEGEGEVGIAVADLPSFGEGFGARVCGDGGGRFNFCRWGCVGKGDWEAVG